MAEPCSTGSPMAGAGSSGITSMIQTRCPAVSIRFVVDRHDPPSRDQAIRERYDPRISIDAVSLDRIVTD